MAKTAVTPEPAIYCRKCSYDLRGQVEHRCPECGQAYDPANAKTFRRRPSGRAGKWVKRVAALLVVLLLIAAAPYAWLYYEWRQEQPAVKRMTELGSTVRYKTISVPIIPRLLPGRYGWMLERVQVIRVYRGGPTDADLVLISRCRRLEELITEFAYVTDKGVEAVSELKELRELALSGPGITDASARRLAQCPQLGRLVLIDTSLTDGGLGQLSGLTQLTQLWVGSPALTDAGLPALANLPNLRALVLLAPCAGDAGLATLSRQSRLQWLYVAADGYTPAGAKHLRESLPNCEIQVYRYTRAPATSPSP